MKRIICLWIVVLFSVSLAIGQGKGGTAVRKPAPVSKSAEAEKAWILFWKTFKDSIKNRDKESLKILIAEDYGEASNDGQNDRREIFFELGWDNIRKDFLGKTRLNGRYRLSKIQEFELDSGVQIIRYWDSEFGEWGTYSFYYTPTGQWYLKHFEAGCTA